MPRVLVEYVIGFDLEFEVEGADGDAAIADASDVLSNIDLMSAISREFSGRAPRVLRSQVEITDLRTGVD